MRFLLLFWSILVLDGYAIGISTIPTIESFSFQCSEASATTRARCWPEDRHGFFCLESAPKLINAFKNVVPEWNEAAVLLAVNWTLAEAGWGRFQKNGTRKHKDYCFWGFAHKEKVVDCKEKTLEDGVLAFVNYLRKGHEETDEGKVPYRSQNCGPHRNLIKTFKDQRVSRVYPENCRSGEGYYLIKDYITAAELKDVDFNHSDLRRNLNYLLRSSGFQKEKYWTRYLVEGDVFGSIQSRKGKMVAKPRPGEGLCTYNIDKPDYSKHIQQVMSTMVRMCDQIFDDIKNPYLESGRKNHEAFQNYLIKKYPGSKDALLSIINDPKKMSEALKFQSFYKKLLEQKKSPLDC